MTHTPVRFCQRCGAARAPGLGWCAACHARDDDGEVTLGEGSLDRGDGTWPGGAYQPPVPVRRRAPLLLAAAAALVTVAAVSYVVADVVTTDEPARSAQDLPSDAEQPQRGRGAEKGAAEGSMSPSAPTSGPTEPSAGTPSGSPTATSPPAAVDGEQRNLGCGSGYVVVLASDAEGTAEQTVQSAFDRFPSAPDRHYLDPARSCSNLSSMTDKTALGLVPYMGPFDDPVTACEARMDHLDPTAYVVGVETAATTATYCACPYETSAIPTLGPEADADPVGDNRFWVLELQYMLHDAGYNPDRLVPGTYGPLTTDMVEQVQIRGGLPVTGSTDTDTWSAVKDLAC